MEDITKLTDEELYEGLDALSDAAAEIRSERAAYGDSAPGTARTLSILLAYEAEAMRRFCAQPEPPDPDPILQEDECPF